MVRSPVPDSAWTSPRRWRRALRDQRFTKIAIPGPQVVVLFLGLSAVAGVIGAIGPARSAGKVDVLMAVVTD